MLRDRRLLAHGCGQGLPTACCSRLYFKNKQKLLSAHGGEMRLSSHARLAAERLPVLRWRGGGGIPTLGTPPQLSQGLIQPHAATSAQGLPSHLRVAQAHVLRGHRGHQQSCRGFPAPCRSPSQSRLCLPASRRAVPAPYAVRGRVRHKAGHRSSVLPVIPPARGVAAARARW